MISENLKLERANFTDAKELASICKKSFDQEMILNRDGKPGGPPSYDDPDWHIYSMKEGFYNKIIFDGKIVGSIIMALRGEEDNTNLVLFEKLYTPRT